MKNYLSVWATPGMFMTNDCCAISIFHANPDIRLIPSRVKCITSWFITLPQVRHGTSGQARHLRSSTSGPLRSCPSKLHRWTTVHILITTHLIMIRFSIEADKQAFDLFTCKVLRMSNHIINNKHASLLTEHIFTNWCTWRFIPLIYYTVCHMNKWKLML